MQNKEVKTDDEEECDGEQNKMKTKQKNGIVMACKSTSWTLKIMKDSTLLVN